MLLENAGPKAKYIGIHLMIDILGIFVARLKHESVLCCKEKLWVVLFIVVAPMTCCHVVLFIIVFLLISLKNVSAC